MKYSKHFSVSPLRLPIAIVTLIVIGTNAACLVRTRKADLKPILSRQTASLSELTSIIKQFDAIQTLSADVQLQLSFLEQDTKSIKEFRDVPGFILIRQPHEIRVRALVPVVRYTALDMASSGEVFQVHIPSKDLFFVGDTALTTPSLKRVGNIRPQHILNALLIMPPDENQGKLILENVISGDKTFHVVGFITTAAGGEELRLRRKIWFDRADLSITRQQIYDDKGNVVTNAWYREWSTENMVPFPRYVVISRPVDGYDLHVRILKVILNGSIPENSFKLTPPPGIKVEHINKDMTVGSRVVQP